MVGSGQVLQPRPAEVPLGDLALARRLWLLLLATFTGFLPLTAVSLFLPAMAVDLGTNVAIIGGLRGLGGLAALAVGILVAPLLDRLPRAVTATAGLVVLALASAIVAGGSLGLLVIGYLLLGAAGAVLQPALQAAAADDLGPGVGARAAALLSAVGGLSATVAAPLLALPAIVWGWRGDFLAIAVALGLLALLCRLRLSRRPPTGVTRVGYLASFRLVAATPGAPGLLVGSFFRSTAWLGWITYLAAYYATQFAADSGLIAVAWTLGGGAFFVANLVTGRLAARSAAGWRSPERVLLLGLLMAVALAPLSLLTPTLPLALLGSTAYAGVQGAALGATISLLVGRYSTQRGAVLGLNAAGLNLGAFAGAALVGLGIGLNGFQGAALVLVVVTLAALVTTAWTLRRSTLSPSSGE